MSRKPRNKPVHQRIFDAMHEDPFMMMLVIDCIDKHTNALLADEDETRRQLKDSFVHPDAWIATAKELRKVIETKNQK